MVTSQERLKLLLKRCPRSYEVQALDLLNPNYLPDKTQYGLIDRIHWRHECKTIRSMQINMFEAP